MLGVVAVICLGLGGWHLLMKYGQYVEAEPAVVGQPIKIHGRFFHFFAGEDSGCFEVRIDRKNGSREGVQVNSVETQSVWCRYDVEIELAPVDEPTEFTMWLGPFSGDLIQGQFTVRPAE